MSAFRPYPKFLALVETPEGWTPALYEDGESVWTHGEDPDRAARFCLEQCEKVLPRYPDAVLIVVDPEGVEIHRFEPVTSDCPF